MSIKYIIISIFVLWGFIAKGIASDNKIKKYTVVGSVSVCGNTNLLIPYLSFMSCFIILRYDFSLFS